MKTEAVYTPEKGAELRGLIQEAVTEAMGAPGRSARDRLVEVLTTGSDDELRSVFGYWGMDAIEELEKLV